MSDRDEHWWFDLWCPECWDVNWQPLAVARDTRTGRSLSLPEDDSGCPVCGYMLKTGDLIVLAKDEGAFTVKRTTYKIPSTQDAAGNAAS